MKAILISIRPQHTCNILNGIKWWEIRKKFPKDYVGWVYIYVTKDKNLLRKVVEYDESSMNWYQPHYEIINDKNCNFDILNGKVVARFWCDKVEEILFESYLPDDWDYDYETEELGNQKLYNNSCLSKKELNLYLLGENGYAIHITKLEIFDEPKEISEFMKTLDNFNGLDCFRCSKHRNCSFNRDKKCEKLKLTRAPQSWQFIEI